jgi:hypothetical protein
MIVRAKFRCRSREIQEQGEVIKLSPVTGGSPENDLFYKWTPAGEILLQTINGEAGKQFVPGKDYYVDFTFAEQGEK